MVMLLLKNVLTKDEIKEGVKLFLEDWNHVSPNFDFKDTNTWTTNK